MRYLHFHHSISGFSLFSPISTACVTPSLPGLFPSSAAPSAEPHRIGPPPPPCRAPPHRAGPSPGVSDLAIRPPDLPPESAKPGGRENEPCRRATSSARAHGCDLCLLVPRRSEAGAGSLAASARLCRVVDFEVEAGEPWPQRRSSAFSPSPFHPSSPWSPLRATAARRPSSAGLHGAAALPSELLPVWIPVALERPRRRRLPWPREPTAAAGCVWGWVWLLCSLSPPS
jgi:hypothetical protein